MDSFSNAPWHGILVATALPLGSDLSIDLDAYAGHVSFLAAGGCHGVVPNGSLGEYQTLTPEERAQVVRAAVDAAPAGFPVVPGVAAYGALEAARWTEQAAQQVSVLLGSPASFRKATGYVGGSLDGLWLRAPYLHTGSVPTLEDLLEPQAKRPTVFYRGYDVYDRKRTGFIHRGEEILKTDPVLQQSREPARLMDRLYFRYVTGVAGNANAGHEGKVYGTELPPEEKKALVEYLKTL